MNNKQFGGTIFFDLTQLILKIALPTPNGIGRVELAYAKYLLEHYPRNTRFVFAVSRLRRVIPNRLMARYIRQIEIIWSKKDTASYQTEERIHVCLGGHLPGANKQSDVLKVTESNRAKRLAIAANLLASVILNPARRLNLSCLDKRDQKHAYVCVSHSTVMSSWLIRRLGQSPSVAGIFLLHDIIPISHPEFTLPISTVRHQRYVARLANSAKAVIVNSKYTSDCLEAYARTRNLSFPEVLVAPLGVDDSFVTANVRRRLTVKPYFVFTATIEPRKNHILLLQVWQRLVVKLGADSPTLLLIGRRGRENENTLDIIERAETLREFVIECGNVPDQLLRELLVNARAALFPSHIEGYGLPLAEALTLGVPVICSDIPPFREIGEEIPEYVDPLAGRGWLKLITEYAVMDSPRRAAQLARMKQYAPPRWDDHFKALDLVLRRIDAATSNQSGQTGDRYLHQARQSITFQSLDQGKLESDRSSRDII